MTNSSLELDKREVIDFTTEQKIKLMQFAVFDKEFVERCNAVQSEMENLDSK